MFSPDDMKIFCYSPDGTKQVYADPLVLRRALMMASGGEFDSLHNRSYLPAPGPDGAPIDEPMQVVMDREDAQEKLILCVRAAFGMQPVDAETGKGATEAMCWAVFKSYSEFVSGNSNGGASGGESSLPLGSPTSSV